MENKKVWLITGAGRGMGVDIAKAALAAGYYVVATGRNTEKVAAAIGAHDNLVIAQLDVTSESDAANVVQKAVEKFGRIDVLINNAANFKAGFFEELSMDQINQQLQTSLIGPMIVTRAVLPLMRKQQAGHVITISSTAGLGSFEFCSAYSAAKFGLEGWMQALRAEVAPFGIQTTTVNPGFFRTELLTKESTEYADHPINDYGQRREQQMEFWQGANGKQGGDPAKLAAALVTIAAEPQPPLRFLAGADAIGLAEQVIDKLQKETNAYRELSGFLSFDDSNK